MMQVETPRFVTRCESASSASTFESDSSSRHKKLSTGSGRRSTTDVLFETQEALIRITGPVKGFANHLTSVAFEGSANKSNGGYGPNFYSSQYSHSQRDLIPDFDDISEFVPEDAEEPGVLRRMSSSISEVASAIINRHSSSHEDDSAIAPDTFATPISTRKSSHPVFSSGVNSAKSSALKSSKLSSRRGSSSHGPVFESKFDVGGSDAEFSVDDDDAFENISGHHNPFLSDVNHNDNFYDSSPVAVSKHLSSSNPMRTSFSAIGFQNHSPESYQLANSFSSFDLNFSDRDRRRSLDIGFTDGFFEEPRSVTSLSHRIGRSISVHDKSLRKQQLMAAIEQCKRLLKQNEGDEQLKEKFGHQLVKLRLLLLEESDAPEEEEKTKRLNGHKFVASVTRATSKSVCEHCKQLLIGLVHSWFECVTCGFRVHDKCLDAVVRLCPSIRLEESKEYMWTICDSSGLAKQNFRCADCKSLIGNGCSLAFSVGGSSSSLSSLKSVSSGGDALLCDYSGLYYCSQCHWNDLMVIPARVVFNWDFRPYRVSRYWRSYLQILYKKPVINISELNASLYNHIEELSLVDVMRKDILKMKKYFVACRNASANRLLLLLQSRQHFVENSDMYSLRDLVDVENKSLVNALTQVHSLYASHIRKDCEICRNRGFICEICNSSQVIFPFDRDVFVCPHCSSTYHENCFENANHDCSRCSRRRQRKSTNTTLVSADDLDS